MYAIRSYYVAAELLWVHFLTPDGTSGDKKREIIRTVLSWMEQPVEIPSEMSKPLDYGFVPADLGDEAEFDLGIVSGHVITSYSIHYTKLYDDAGGEPLSPGEWLLELYVEDDLIITGVITSYSIHYTKLYERSATDPTKLHRPIEYHPDRA